MVYTLQSFTIIYLHLYYRSGIISWDAHVAGLNISLVDFEDQEKPQGRAKLPEMLEFKARKSINGF